LLLLLPLLPLPLLPLLLLPLPLRDCAATPGRQFCEKLPTEDAR